MEAKKTKLVITVVNKFFFPQYFSISGGPSNVIRFFFYVINTYLTVLATHIGQRNKNRHTTFGK